jgi:hypothetical protein
LNAANANENAFANASANSQVGQVAIYRDAVNATDVAMQDWTTAYSEYDIYRTSYLGKSVEDITTLLVELDDTDPAYADLQADLQKELTLAREYEAELANLASISNEKAVIQKEAASLEDDALLQASGGRILSDAALAQLRAMLGL